MDYFTNSVLSKCRRLHKVKVFTFTEWQSSHSRVSEVPGALAVPVLASVQLSAWSRPELTLSNSFASPALSINLTPAQFLHWVHYCSQKLRRCLGQHVLALPE